MTDDQMQSVREDIAYIRAMAQEGRKTPLLGGSILIAAGLIFGTASVLHYLIDTGIIAVPPMAMAILWGGALAVFFAVLTVLNIQIGKKPGAFSPMNRATGAAWMGVGLGIFVMSISIAIISWNARSEVPALIFPSLIFASYGAGWAVSATMSDKKWLWWLAIGAWIGAPAIAIVAGQPEQYLAYAVGLLLLTIVPGVAMLRQEPAPAV